MAEYRIDRDGDLWIDDDDGDTTMTPKRDFPQVLALIAPQVSATAADKPWYTSDGSLWYRGRSPHVIGNPEACPDDQDIVPWVLETQPVLSAADLNYLTTDRNTSSECAARLREIRSRMEAVPAKEGPWYVRDGKLRYHGRPVHVAETKYDDAGVVEWVVANQPKISADDLDSLTGSRGGSSQDCLRRLREIRSQPQVAPAKEGPWYMSGEYLKHQSHDVYIIDTDCGDEFAEMAAWCIANQPEVDNAGLSAASISSSRKALDYLREIRAALESPATVEAAPARVVFSIEDGDLMWQHDGRPKIIYMADDDDTGNNTEDAPEPRTYRAEGEWLIKHQPAISIDAVKAWGEYQEAADAAYAFIAATAAPPAPRWTLDEDGDLFYNGQCVALHHADSEGLFGRIIAQQPAITAELAAAAIDGSSRAALDMLRPLVEAEATAAEVPMRPGLFAIKRKIGETVLCHNDSWLYVMQFDRGDLAAWFIANQPAVDTDTLDRWSRIDNDACRDAMEAFRQQQNGEVARDCDCVSAAPETPVQRNVVITITFDPADTKQATEIYKAISTLMYTTRRDCVRTHVD